MHGITKEIWRLVCASRAFHDGEIRRRAVARACITRCSRRSKNTPVSGSACSPTSSRAPAPAGSTVSSSPRRSRPGQSLDPLTDLWMTSADVEALIDTEAAPKSRFSKAWAMPLAWMAAGRSTDKVEALDEPTREEVRTKLSHFVRSRWFEPPFGGKTFTNLLLDAFDAMGASERGTAAVTPRPAARPVRDGDRLLGAPRTVAAQFACRGRRDGAPDGRRLSPTTATLDRYARAATRNSPSRHAPRRAFQARFRPSRSPSSTAC